METKLGGAHMMESSGRHRGINVVLGVHVLHYKFVFYACYVHSLVKVSLRMPAGACINGQR